MALKGSSGQSSCSSWKAPPFPSLLYPVSFSGLLVRAVHPALSCLSGITAPYTCVHLSLPMGGASLVSSFRKLPASWGLPDPHFREERTEAQDQPVSYQSLTGMNGEARTKAQVCSLPEPCPLPRTATPTPPPSLRKPWKDGVKWPVGWR